MKILYTEIGVRMGKHSPVAIAPKYMESFQCIGSECEENCCHGWRVNIDKQTYKKYRAVKIVPLNDKLKKSLILSDDMSNSDNHASIKLDVNGHCPFLDEKKLCEIQGALGYTYLSKTCQTYPRQYTRKNDEFSLYASLSCPEAARHALLTPDSMHSIQIKLPFHNESEIPLASLIRCSDQSTGLILGLTDYIYEVTKYIFSFSGYKSWEAMLVLGLMVQKVSRYIVDHDVESARALTIDALINFTEPQYLLQAGVLARGLLVDREKQIRLLKGVLNIYFSKNQPRTSYRQTILEAISGMDLDDNDLDRSEASYCDAEVNWFKPFDDAHPHLLKNYLLNDIGKSSFPLGKNRGLETEFIDLAIRFSIIKMTLIGISGLKKGSFCAEDYVRVIYTFSRNVEHSPTFMMELLSLLDKDGLRSIAGAIIMLR